MSKNKKAIILYNAFCVAMSFALSILNAYWQRPGWSYLFAALAVTNGICILINKSEK